MDEKRISELTALQLDLRREVIAAKASVAQVGGDPDAVGGTAFMVCDSVLECVREIKRYRGILRGLGACLGSAYDLLPEQFRPEVADSANPQTNEELARVLIGGVIQAGVEDDVRRAAENAIDRIDTIDEAPEDDEERPASSKTEPAPPLLDEEPTAPANYDPPRTAAEDRTLPLFDAIPPASPPMHAPADTAIPERKPDPTDATVAGRKRAEEPERTAAEWSPDSGEFPEYDPTWLATTALDRFRAEMGAKVKLARWGRRFRAWLMSLPEDQVKRMAA